MNSHNFCCLNTLHTIDYYYPDIFNTGVSTISRFICILISGQTSSNDTKDTNELFFCKDENHVMQKQHHLTSTLKKCMSVWSSFHLLFFYMPWNCISIIMIPMKTLTVFKFLNADFVCCYQKDGIYESLSKIMNALIIYQN